MTVRRSTTRTTVRTTVRTTARTAVRTRLAALAAAAMLTGAALSGCGGARNSLGTAASSCFRALPPARDAVSRKGKFLGVRKIGTATLQHRLPADTKLAAVKDKELCVFAFKDSFKPADVRMAATSRPGTYAVVAVTIRHPTVVAAFIVDRLPGRFGHLR
jgi:hypothetical protein